MSGGMVHLLDIATAIGFRLVKEHEMQSPGSCPQSGDRGQGE